MASTKAVFKEKVTKRKAAGKSVIGKAGSSHGAAAVQGSSLARRTITLPPLLDEQIEAAVGQRNFSAFAQRALRHELQRETIASWLDEREAARNGKPLDPEAVKFAKRAWAQRK